ncbi:unnamed protein product, partial [Laminaria digitata]
MGRFQVQEEDVPQDFPASGNIAQVLRQARASLKDPSRPFTPTERRLRSTKSLFGEAEFRPTKTESTRRRSRTRSSRDGRNDSVFSRKRLGSDHAVGSKQPASALSEGVRRESVGSTSLAATRGSSKLGLTRRYREVDVGGHHHQGDPTTSSAEWRVSGCDATSGVYATTNAAAVLADGVDHRTAAHPSLSPLHAPPPLPAVDLGILYVDGACARRGSMSSAAMNQQWSSSSSSSSSSVTSTTGSIDKKVGLANPRKERNEYEGLYGSDDDLDTSAWNLDSSGCCATGNSQTQAEEKEKEENSAATASELIPRDDDDDTCLDFILDAIDNEVDLGCVSSSDGLTDGGSDASPDPGASEGQRERNARLAELVRMLAHGPTDERLGWLGGSNSTGAVVANGSGGLWSPALLNRVRDVLFRVMGRPRGTSDASPSSVTELPGLLAARLVIGFAAPSPRVARSGVETRPRSGRPRDGAKEGSGHLAKACRHLFEVSKKAGADRAFFSSGTVTCLLEFIELVASEMNALSSTTTTTTTAAVRQHADGDGRGLRGELDGGGFGFDDSEGNNSQERGSGGSSSSSSNRSRRSTIRKCSAETANLYVERICDALTFAVGCLKNVSASGSLQHRLVQAGAAHVFCSFVRSIRDLCHRCDESQRQTPRPLSTNDAAELANLSPGSTGKIDREFDGKTGGEIGENSKSGGEIGDIGEIGGQTDGGRGGQRRENLTNSLRKRVSTPLALTIGLLRDLAAGKGKNDDLRAAGAVSVLCSVLRPFRDQLDVVLNTARALAKLSLQERTRGEMASDSAHVRDLLAALVEQGRQVNGDFGGDSSRLEEKDGGSSDSPAIVVSAEQRRYWEKEEKRVAACIRIAFILGNLTSLGEDTRKLIGLRLGGVESLPGLLETSARAHLSAWECLCIPAGGSIVTPAGREAGMAENTSFSKKIVSLGMEGAGFEESWSRKSLRRACDGLEEMLVKTVRLLANISINREVGQRVCCHPGLVAVEPLLGKCLEVFELFEDGIIVPHVPRRQGLHSLQGLQSEGGCWRVDSGTGGPVEELIPGEELLLNVVSLVANLSFYGSWANDRPPVHARRDSSFVEPFNSSCCFGNRRSTGLASTDSRPVFRNTLFGLASKARRSSADEEATLEAGKGDDGLLASGTGGGSSSSGIGGGPSLAPSHGPANGRGTIRREVLTGHLVKVLLHPNAEAVAEAARAFGNFSRDPSCREAMSRRRADEVLVALLEHACREVVFAAAGALVNVAADPARKTLLSREGVDAGEVLARLVRRAGLSDPRMAEIACQALHNLMIEPVPAGGAREILGGIETYKKLWWTLRELVEACSSEGGRGVQVGGGGGGGGGSLSVGGFAAAAAALLRAMDTESVD